MEETDRLVYIESKTYIYQKISLRQWKAMYRIEGIEVIFCMYVDSNAEHLKNPTNQ